MIKEQLSMNAGELPPLSKDLRQVVYVKDMPEDLARDVRAAIKAYQEGDES